MFTIEVASLTEADNREGKMSAERRCSELDMSTFNEATSIIEHNNNPFFLQ